MDNERERPLTWLGRSGGGPITAADLDTFQRPAGLQVVILTSDEFTAVCPVTSQPDWYTVRVRYFPRQSCLESKALKLYLQGFRNEGVFCEALAAQLARELRDALDADLVEVTLTQKPRGGISIEAQATAESRQAGSSRLAGS
jgi:7-cyano-7-deazaguanine reductase